MRKFSGMVDKLNDNQVIVIGTNPLGINGSLKTNKGGAALFALKRGWISQGERMNNCLSKSGKAWGLVTVTGPGKKRSKSPYEIKLNILKLYDYATKNPDKEFLIAFTGIQNYNLNGYSNKELAGMFSWFDIPANITFEEEFSKLLDIC
jgi:hypothetical protein